MKTNGLMTLGELESYFFDRVRKGVVAHGKTAATSLKERRTRSVVELTPLGGAAIPPDPDGPTVRGPG